jgi:glycosyltransferase involved in cell wall biosynthesis
MRNGFVDKGFFNAATSSSGFPLASVAISVVAPCHNEEECICEFYSRMSRVLEQSDASYEIVFVNDGSSDRTGELLAEIAQSDKHVVAVELSRNHGHQLALTAGLEVARGERILIIDADLQDPPELLPKLMAAMDSGADVAYAKRLSRTKETIFKKLTAGLFYRLLRRVSRTNIPVDTGDFRLISRQVADILRAMPEPDRFIRGMVAWVGFRQVAVEYHRDPRYAGVTKYSFSKMLGLAIDAVTGFATAPLRFLFFFAVMALAAAVGSFAWAGYVAFSRHLFAAVTTLLAVQFFFTSVVFFALAMIGEYVSRAFLQGKRRPLVLIRSINGCAPEAYSGGVPAEEEPVSIWAR